MALTDAERAISRARSLMQNKGYGWSKAVDRAAETLTKEPAQCTPASKPKG